MTIFNDVKSSVFHGNKTAFGMPDADIAKLHDLLMYMYGWIPLSEFRDMPAETVINLISAASSRVNSERSNMQHMHVPKFKK